MFLGRSRVWIHVNLEPATNTDPFAQGSKKQLKYIFVANYISSPEDSIELFTLGD